MDIYWGRARFTDASRLSRFSRHSASPRRTLKRRARPKAALLPPRLDFQGPAATPDRKVPPHGSMHWPALARADDRVRPRISLACELRTTRHGSVDECSVWQPLPNVSQGTWSAVVIHVSILSVRRSRVRTFRDIAPNARLAESSSHS